MDREVKYKISFAGDLSGIQGARAAMANLNSATEDAFSTMGSRAGQAQQAFMGMQMALNGDATAVFGVARALKVLWEVFSAGAPILRILTLLSLGLAAVSWAWKEMRGRQEEGAKAMQDAARASDEFQKSLRNLHAARNALNMDAETQSLDRLAKAFDQVSAAMKNMDEAEEKLRNVRAQGEIAKIDEERTVRLRQAGGDPYMENSIRSDAARKAEAVKYALDQGNTEAQKKSVQEQMALSRERLNALTATSISAEYNLSPAMVKSKQKVAGLAEELRGLGAGENPDKEKWLAKRQEYEDALNENKKLQAVNEQIAKNTQDQIAAEKQKITMYEKELTLLQAQQETRAAEHSAANAATDAEQENTRKSIDQEKAQARQKAEADQKHEQEKIAAKQVAAALDESAKEDAETVRNLKEDEAAANRRAAYTARIASDPAFAQSEASKENRRQSMLKAARRQGLDVSEDDSIEEIQRKKQLARAQELKARGLRGSGIDRVLAAEEARKAAEQIKRDREAAERRQAENIAASAKSLSKIEEYLKGNLQGQA